MHPSIGKTRKAIALIRDTKETVAELLADTPDFKTQANHVFETLANGLAFAIGEKVIHSGRTRTEVISQPAQRTIMGVPVPDEKPLKQRVQEVQPSISELDKFRTEIDKAYIAFGRMSNKEILNEFHDLEIRAVAKRAGLQVTKTEPVRITDSFVSEIKNAIQEKADAEAAQKEATTPKTTGKKKDDQK